MGYTFVTLILLKLLILILARIQMCYRVVNPLEGLFYPRVIVH